MKTKNAIVQLITFQWSPHPPCCCTIWLSETLPARISTGIVDMPIEISYEIICALERRPPSSEYLLFDDHPASTMPYTPSDEIDENEEEADRHRRERHVDRAPLRVPRRAVRDHRPGEQRRNERHHRRENEEREVRLPRVRLFLHDVLHAVGDGLQQSVRADAVWSAAILDERADAPLGPDDEHHADHVDRESEQHLHDRGEEPGAAARPAAAACTSRRLRRRRRLEQREQRS